MELKVSKDVEYDTENAKRIFHLLNETEIGLTIGDIANSLKLNRHTVTKLCEKMLIEKKINYGEKGPAKIYYSAGQSKFIGRIGMSNADNLWIDVFRHPRYHEQEEFVRINQTKHDSLIRASSKFKSVGAVAVRRTQLVDLIKMLCDVAKKEFGIKI